MAAEHRCHLCGAATDTFTRDAVSGDKVPICEKCFLQIYPSEKSKQTLRFWATLYPIVKEVHL